MAGGEGTRLRPLTCDCPKPMIRLMNRPVMQYALALLKKHGVCEVAATLGYLPDAIRDRFAAGDAYGVSLRYTVERTPLGTAGGVKQASDFLDETFAVLSGDGITDLDLTDALAFHRRKGALATLVLKQADNPLDYGVVLAGPDGRVRSFHEKPDWSEVVSDTVNTGIYILEPEVLAHIPEGRACDFGHDLFPELVKKGLPVYGYVMQGYWCDIGDTRAYLQAHMDALEGRIRLEGLIPSGRVAQLPGAVVDRSAVLEGPCLIGQNVRVLAGACVGPYSVIGDGCVIGQGASVKRSVLWPGARLERGAQARGCVLGAGAVLGEGAQAYEESVLGTGATACARAVLLPGVKLWPGKRASDGERLNANRVWGRQEGPLFADGALPLSAPDQALRAIQALCAALSPRQLMLGRGGGGAAEALWHAAASGALAQGVNVLDAGVCALPQLRHALLAAGCDCGALVEDDTLIPMNALGARLLKRQQRAVAAQAARQDFAAPFSGRTPAVERADALRAAYVTQLAAAFTPGGRAAPPVVLAAEDETLLCLAEDALGRAGIFTRRAPEAGMAAGPGEVGLALDRQGERCALWDESGPLSEGEQQLMTAWTLLCRGEQTLLLPVQATRAAEALARRFDARVEYVAGESALWMNALAERFPEQFALQFDGLRAAIEALSALSEAGMTLSAWRRDMPAVWRRSRSVPVSPTLTGRVLRALASREKRVELGGGMRFFREGGWAWICPDEGRGAFRVVAEAASDETARELCDFCESELRRLSAGKSAPGRLPEPPARAYRNTR